MGVKKRDKLCAFPLCVNFLGKGSRLRCEDHKTSCFSEGCYRLAGGLIGRYCEMHRGRLRTKGVLGSNEMLTAEKGTGTITKSGYRVVYLRDKEGAALNKAILEHRKVMGDYLGRELQLEENVHHINGDRLDNRLENLELWSSSQPPGQRIEDKVNWAKEILEKYGQYVAPNRNGKD